MIPNLLADITKYKGSECCGKWQDFVVFDIKLYNNEANWVSIFRRRRFLCQICSSLMKATKIATTITARKI